MAALELHDVEGPVSKEAIERAIQGLESPLQKVYTVNLLYCMLEIPGWVEMAMQILVAFDGQEKSVCLLSSNHFRSSFIYPFFYSFIYSFHQVHPHSPIDPFIHPATDRQIDRQ